MPGKLPSVKSAKTGAKSRPAKSKKADGTPKKRWSSADRAARGHTPRRSGGQPRTTTRSSNEASFDRETSASTTRGRTSIDRPQSTTRREWTNTGDSSASRESAGRKPESNRESRYDRAARNDNESRYERAPRGDSGSSFDRAPRNSDRYERAPRSSSSEARYERAPRTTEARYEQAPRSSGERYDRAPRNDGNSRYDRAPRRDQTQGDRSQGDRVGRRDASGFRKDAPYEARNDRPARPARGGAGNSSYQRPTRSNDFTPRTSTVLSRQDRPVRSPAVVEPTNTSNDQPAAVSGDFGSLGLPASLVATLKAQGITAPFPIQAATIPDALKGRDILGRGQTGSGKTLAFGLPMIATLAGSDASLPRGLVLVPTRELAMQVEEALTPLVRTAGLKIVLVAGGMSYTPQLRAFSSGVDIVVATPGRLIDLMEQRAVDLSRVEITVLDEADHMADLGFMPAVTEILDAIPSGGQRMLFSATLDRGIDRLVKKYLESPLTHEVDSDQASVTTMAHHVLHIAPKDKVILTAEIASREGRTLIFVRTQRGADRVAEQLRGVGIMAGALHGGLAQGARTRILAAFKEGQVPVLVATDVAARGIHVDDIGLVLQADPPGGPKEYLHRAGRTARAGGTGVVVTLVLPHQRREISSLTNQAGVRPTALPAQSGDTELVEVTGARQPAGDAISEADFQRLISPPARRRPGGGNDRPRGRGGRDGGRSYGGSRDGERRTSRSHHRAYTA